MAFMNDKLYFVAEGRQRQIQIVDVHKGDVHVPQWRMKIDINTLKHVHTGNTF